MPDKKHDPYTTLAICVACLVLGVPIASVAIDLESTFMPTMPLKVPGTITNVPHIALFGAAFTAIATSIIVMLVSVTVRHLKPGEVLIGFVGLGMAGINVAAQLIILSTIYISNSANPESKSTNEVKFVNGQYDAGGKTFTRETWSCMMGNLYLAREPWATNACSEYHYARYCTILLTVTSVLLLGIAYWPVRNDLVSRRDSGEKKEGR